MKFGLFRETLKVALIEMLRVLPYSAPCVQINASYNTVTFTSETPEVISRATFATALATSGVYGCSLVHLAEVISQGGVTVELDATITPGILRIFSEGLSYEIPVTPVHTKIDETWFSGPWDRSNFMLAAKDIRAWSCLRRIVDLGEPGTLVHAGTGKDGLVLDVHADGLDLALRGSGANNRVHRISPKPLAVAGVNTSSLVGAGERSMLVVVNGAYFVFKPLPQAVHRPARSKMKDLNRITRGVRVDLPKLKSVLHTADSGSSDPARQQVRVIAGKYKLSIEYADAFPWKSDISETDGVEQWSVVVRLRELMAAVDQWENRIQLCINQADPQTPIIVSALGGEAAVIVESRKPAIMAESPNRLQDVPSFQGDDCPP